MDAAARARRQSNVASRAASGRNPFGDAENRELAQHERLPADAHWIGLLRLKRFGARAMQPENPLASACLLPRRLGYLQAVFDLWRLRQLKARSRRRYIASEPPS